MKPVDRNRLTPWAVISSADEFSGSVALIIERRMNDRYGMSP